MSKRRSIARSKYVDYVAVAENFYAGAETAKAFDYWNAAGVLIIHAAASNSSVHCVVISPDSEATDFDLSRWFRVVKRTRYAPGCSGGL